MSQNDFKDKAMQTAMRLMQNKKVQKAMENPKVQQVFSTAIDRSVKIQRDFRDIKQQFAAQLELATEDDLESMKMELQRLREEIRQSQSGKSE